jgi:hypothetical protein
MGFPVKIRFRFLAGFRFRPGIGWNLRGGFVSRLMMNLARLVASGGILRPWPAFSPGLAAMRLVALRLPRGLDPAQCPAQVVELALVRQFLAFGYLNQFQNLVNAIHQNLQTFGNLRGMNHGLMNGRRFRGTKISGFYPRLGGRWLRATLRPGRRWRMRAWRALGLLESRGGRGARGNRSGGGRIGRLGQIRLAFRPLGGFRTGVGVAGRVGKLPAWRERARFIGRARAASTSPSATSTTSTVVGTMGGGRQI